MGASYFSKIDLRFGYYQLNIRPENVRKIVFRTRYGHCEFLVMPFGLANAPTKFIDIMNRVCKKNIWISSLLFINDILIYSKMKEEHAEHLRITLETLRKEKLYAKFSKCKILIEQVQFLRTYS